MVPDNDGVATFTLDDPRTRNAVRIDVLCELIDHLERLPGDGRTRVLVLTGSGATFCSGAHRAEAADPSASRRLAELLDRMSALLAALPVPVVCRVNGAAVGAGVALAAAADICIAADAATFSVPEVRFGYVAEPVARALRPRLGMTATLDVLLTGRTFTAGEAHRMGLVTTVAPAAELDDRVRKTVRALLTNEPDALDRTKSLVRVLYQPLHEGS